MPAPFLFLMRILISGSSGLVGTELASFLKEKGHQVVSLKRGNRPSSENILTWDPTNKKAISSDFENFNAVIHLAGKNIASFPWTAKIRREILTSRVEHTRFLSEVLSGLKHPPEVFICASAIGYYGNRGEEKLTEESASGTGFLADVCKEWEKAASEARGIRVIQTRFGHILSPKGGVLKKILPAFQLGLGAILGSGKQIVSWIALEDVVAGLYHCLITQNIEGPMNFTAENPETNASYSKKIAKALKRPLFLRIPEKILKLFFGEMADEMLLASSCVIPQRLKASGYTFIFGTLDKFLMQRFF